MQVCPELGDGPFIVLANRYIIQNTNPYPLYCMDSRIFAEMILQQAIFYEWAEKASELSVRKRVLNRFD
jgi:hypothetical protein